MRRRSRMGSQEEVDVPSTRTSPELGSSRRLMSLRVVVFPSRCVPAASCAHSSMLRFKPLSVGVLPPSCLKAT
jgi:hypothetical protein